MAKKTESTNNNTSQKLVAVGLVVAALLVASQAWLLLEMRALEDRVNDTFQQVMSDVWELKHPSTNQD